MRGKTSILNAVRWVFYGVALGRNLRQISRLNLINRDAADEHDWTMSVSLKFDHNGKGYLLNRKIEKLSNIAIPRTDADFKEVVGLKIDGAVITADSIDNEINQVIPKEVSRFFLFDGELLQEYENLLIEESDQGRKIKTHIESVLGVPALINARDGLDSLLKEARKLQQKDAQQHEDLRSWGQEQMQLQIEQTNLENNLANLTTLLNQYREEMDKLEDYLKNTEATQERQLELTRLNSEKNRIEIQIKKLNIDNHNLIRTLWKDVLASSVQSVVRKLKEDISIYKKSMSESERLQGTIHALQKSLESGEICNICEQTISDSVKTLISEKLNILLMKSQSDKTRDPVKLMDLEEAVDKLSGVRSEGELKRIIANSREITNNLVNLTAVENNFDEILNEIKDYDTEEIMRIRNKKENMEKLLKKTQILIDEDRVKETENSKKQDRISELIIKAGGSRISISNQRVDKTGQLKKVFNEGIEKLRDKLKDDVEKHASEAFHKLTTENEYSSLKINNSYGLSIVDDTGRIVNERSAGAEQIVALSLIHGLNKSSGKVAPIVMDTPFGRLDPRHRKNILEYLPRMSEQIVLLVHEGEIRGKQDLESIAEHVGVRYEIKRHSSTKSSIEKVS